MEKLSPIVLFVYNRVDHTKKVVEGLLQNKEAKDSELYIFADGPKVDASKEEIREIKAVQEYILTIKGFKKHTIEVSEKNRGCAPHTIYAISKIFQSYDKAIILEDDDIPTPYFLSFVNECLNKYQNDSHVWCVSGFTNTNAMIPLEGSEAFMINRPVSWGFGTWKRCWDKVIWDIDNLKGLFRHKSIPIGFDKWEGPDSSTIMYGLFHGNNSSWSIRYNFAAYLNDAKTILPNKSLIINIGCDGTGTHSGKTSKYQITTMCRPVIIPEIIDFDEKRNAQMNESWVPQKLIYRLMHHLGILTSIRMLFNKKHRI